MPYMKMEYEKVRVLIITSDYTYWSIWVSMKDHPKIKDGLAVIYCEFPSYALAAIEAQPTEILLLDHDLGPERGEGLKIVQDYHDKMEIISIGENAERDKYGEFGVSQISKLEVPAKIQEIFEI